MITSNCQDRIYLYFNLMNYFHCATDCIPKEGDRASPKDTDFFYSMFFQPIEKPNRDTTGTQTTGPYLHRKACIFCQCTKDFIL